MLSRHFNSAPLTPVSYESTYSVKLSHRRLPVEVHMQAPQGETVVYCVGCAEARGVEMAAQVLGFATSLVVLAPEAQAA